MTRPFEMSQVSKSMTSQNEQTYLCTLQISNQVGRCRNTTECLAQIGTDQKISFLSMQGQHESTIDMNQMDTVWLKLMRCSVFKVRPLLDPKSASNVPL